MNADRTCFSCDKTLRPTMGFPVHGVKNALFCGDHYQLGTSYVCHPCAGQLTRLGLGKLPSAAD
jgi:hypothetical protein